MTQPDMAARGLPHDAVTEPLEDADGFPSGDDGKPGRHRVTTGWSLRCLEGRPSGG